MNTERRWRQLDQGTLRPGCDLPVRPLSYLSGNPAKTNPKDKRSEKFRELHKYLNSNKEGLLPYQKREKQIPAPKEGIIYKNMGVQESQNCTVITLRMKHRRMRW